MDIVIAAAGQGTRLKNFTDNIPKHIIEIADRPFIYYLLDAAVEAQFRRIIVVGGYQYEKLFSVIQAYESESETEIIAVNQGLKVDKDKYGTACPLLAVEDVVQGDRFVYTMGDHLLSSQDLQAMQMSTHEMLIASYEHNEPERFGVIEETEEHALVKINEKPAHPKSNQVNVGLYTFTKDIFPVAHQLKSSARGEYEITDAINTLARQKTVRVMPLNGYWIDLGRPEDITALEQFMKTARL